MQYIKPQSIFTILFFTALVFVQCSNTVPSNVAKSVLSTNDSTPKDTMKVIKTEEEWKQQLTPQEYKVLREKATDRPYTGEYESHWDSGIYVCKGCGTELFRSETKFDAGCGWPSFYQGIDSSKITEIVDKSMGMYRVEVLCSKCGGHLGHVFTDGFGTPTGLRYCINSTSLGFKKKE
jgi:peptide-methionine (R)-S-oxide reductase